MTTIYADYADEPEEVFYPLPDDLACRYYDLEMDSYREDCDFYNSILPEQGKILEIGCGSGRVTRELVSRKRMLYGIDISPRMLNRARKRLNKHNNDNGHVHWICMDMMQVYFATVFDGIIIPYNTLNLLTASQNVVHCLRACRKILSDSGKLLLQLHIPSGEFYHKQTKTFQFQIFDRPEGGRLIKEVIRKYNGNSQIIEIEERYRVRPMQPGAANEDWSTTFTTNAFSYEQWLDLFSRSGFKTLKQLGDFTGTVFNKSEHTTLIAELTPQA